MAYLTGIVLANKFSYIDLCRTFLNIPKYTSARKTDADIETNAENWRN
jgi:hypothetical protein